MHRFLKITVSEATAMESIAVIYYILPYAKVALGTNLAKEQLSWIQRGVYILYFYK